MMLASSIYSPCFKNPHAHRRERESDEDDVDGDNETSILNDVIPLVPLVDHVTTTDAPERGYQREGDGAVAFAPEEEEGRSKPSKVQKDLAVQRITLVGELQKALRTKSSSLSPIMATEESLLLDRTIWRCFPASCTPSKPLVSALRGSSRSGLGCKKIVFSSGNTNSRTTSPTKRRVRGLWNDKCTCLFTQLHDDMMLFIFSYLSMMEMSQSSHVCRRWRYLSGLEQAWKNVEATDFVHGTFRQNSASFAERTSQVLDSRLKQHKPESLSIRNIEYRLTASVFVPDCHGLQELTLTGFSDLTDTHVHAMLLSQTMMQQGKGCYNPKGNTLRKLVLDYCPLLTNASVRSIALYCSHLECLSLRGNRQIDSLLPLRDRWNTKSDSVTAISGCTSSVKPSTPSSQRHFALLPQNGTGRALAASPTISDLSTLFAPPSQRAPSFESALRRPIHGRRATGTSEAPGRLIRLDVSGTRATPDSILDALDLFSAARSPLDSSVKLESLIMSGSGESWTDEHMTLLSCRIDVSHLRVLKLACANPYGATSRLSSLDGLLGKHVSFNPLHLQLLSLSGHANLTAKTVAHMCAHTPQLQELNLDGCRSIGSSSEVEFLARTLSQLASSSLVRLSMARCFSGERHVRLALTFNPNALEQEESRIRSFLTTLVSMEGNKLQEFDVSGWWAVTADDEALLRQSLPDLMKLHVASTRCARAQSAATIVNS